MSNDPADVAIRRAINDPDTQIRNVPEHGAQPARQHAEVRRRAEE
jgi:hypothetical protein